MLFVDVEDNVRGAWQLLLFRRDGLEEMRLGVADARRAWRAIVLALPFFALAAFATRQYGPVLAELAHIAAPKTPPLLLDVMAAYVAWLTTIFTMHALARLINQAQKLPVITIVFNWTQLLSTVVIAPLNLLVDVRLLDPRIAIFFLLCFGLYVWILNIWLSRLLLGLDVARAIGVSFVIAGAQYIVQIALNQLLH